MDEWGFEVRYGPFRGVTYPDQALGRVNHLGSKLLGTYERGVVELVADLSRRHETFVDIGAGDGYFCVGVGYLNAGNPPRIIGFEMNRFERKLMQKFARANGVTVDSRGKASPEVLNDLPPGKLLVLMDVEGYESELLDPELVYRLRIATILVETHDNLIAGTSSELIMRFENSHEIERLSNLPVDHRGIDELSGWDEQAAQIAVFDGHSEKAEWLLFVPKDSR